MKEELITFETAKLAKEIGFDENTNEFYTTAGNLTGVMYYDPTPNNRTIDTEWFSVLEKESQAYCTAPIQSLLQRWLREKHYIQINIFAEWNKKRNKITFCNYIISLDENMAGLHYVMSGFDTYEEALEAGLLEALKLIKT